MPIDLADRAAQALRALSDCRLCPRDCRVDRTRGTDGAFCRLDARAPVYKELLSLGEEAAISPTWLVDLGGCSWRCLFCSEWTHVVDPWAKPAVALDPAWFVPKLRLRRAQGARTVSFVGGDPTVSLPAILQMWAQVPEQDRLPVVWNCNGLVTAQALALLDGVVTTWIVDVKYGNPACEQRLSGLAAREAIETALQVAERSPRPPLADEVGDLPPLVVRHLVMPGHVDCCTLPALERLAREHPQAIVNLMTAYLPAGPAGERKLPQAPELARLASPEEVRKATAAARRLVGKLWIDGRMSTDSVVY